MILIYLVSDAYCYYRGGGIGWVATKIPSAYYLGFDPATNRDLSLYKADINGVMINDTFSFIGTGYMGNVLVPIEGFCGYFFDDDSVIVEVLDREYRKSYFKTTGGSVFKEVEYPDTSMYQYVDIKSNLMTIMFILKVLSMFGAIFIGIRFLWINILEF
ncbi:MAG: hypothetical protein Q4F57_04145 [Weeksellaceae bacterium]|nr:hypothetical protein [Weeksellaceae bacterium]